MHLRTFPRGWLRLDVFGSITVRHCIFEDNVCGPANRGYGGAAALWGGEYALLQDCVFRNNSCPDAAGCLSFDAVHRVSIDECDIQVVYTGSNHYNGVYAVNADTIRVTHSRFWSDQAIHRSRNSGLFAKVNVFRGNRLKILPGSSQP